MIINEIQKKYYKNKIQLEARIEYGDKEETLWYSFDRELDSYLTITKHDGFLVGVLLLGMKLGEDIHVKGKLSPKLYYNLSNYYINILKSVIPEYHSIKIYHEGFLREKDYESGSGVVTGFSAGIDSFCTLYDHMQHSVPEEYKITHFLFNNVGSHGEWNSEIAEKVFHDRFNLIKGYSDVSSIPFIKVNSNLSSILNMEFPQTHVPRNVSTALLLQGLIGKYYYASAYKYQDCFVGQSYELGHADPFSIHLLSTETLECISSGCQHSRVEKTANVSTMETSRDWLNVCVIPNPDGSNCSTCVKCSRTLFTLELLGEIDKYNKVFDLDKWNSYKKRYIRKTILNKSNQSHLVDEIRQLATTKNYKFSITDRILGAIVSFNVLPDRRKTNRFKIILKIKLPDRIYLMMKNIYRVVRK
jgi:hypothetical protein